MNDYSLRAISMRAATKYVQQSVLDAKRAAACGNNSPGMYDFALRMLDNASKEAAAYGKTTLLRKIDQEKKKIIGNINDEIASRYQRFSRAISSVDNGKMTLARYDSIMARLRTDSVYLIGLTRCDRLPKDLVGGTKGIQQELQEARRDVSQYALSRLGRADQEEHLRSIVADVAHNKQIFERYGKLQPPTSKSKFGSGRKNLSRIRNKQPAPA